MCEKIFNLKQNMTQDYKSIHEGIRFDCSICLKQFTRGTTLKTYTIPIQGKF